LSFQQAADELSVTVRTIQNWETGGARIPWMAYHLARHGLARCCLGWVDGAGSQLFSPAGRSFDAAWLQQQ